MTKIQNLSGGCQCGSIRFRINGEPLTLYACHCLDCQAQSASAFGLSLWVCRNDLELISGKLKFWSTKADDGSNKHCAFCADCGTRIYHAGDDTEIVSLKAGSLDDKSILSPVAHIWTKRAHRWLKLENQNAPCFYTAPDSEQSLKTAWKTRMQETSIDK